METLEELLESDDPRFQHTIALYRWSTSIEGYNPFQLFLDLTGWSVENLGENLYNPTRHKLSAIQHIELDYLADALKEYAIRPQDIHDFVDKLIEGELNDD